MASASVSLSIRNELQRFFLSLHQRTRISHLQAARIERIAREQKMEKNTEIKDFTTEKCKSIE